MAEFVKFVYVMIIFIFLCLVVENIDGFRCLRNLDCPDSMCSSAYTPRCRHRTCVCLNNDEIKIL
ncbi:putative Late nodulin [Medicago truncatula]|uniref:Nodule Cysteine-Rich (NCR) secreted peptide n=1 Tax=Medicago truncatula TaxID=3880 RepID=G7J277_MEDTR|nr:Nodule Cysteine-Rich (NCR) secreted peptide [Medicago truncatula]RHN67514.1 putative Late nodulin [Medicago truncatula]